jgi:hypothetical protein
MKPEQFDSFEQQTHANYNPVPDEIVLKLPACVRLDGEYVAIVPSEDAINKYRIRIENDDGLLRPLTNDEELAFGLAPASGAARTAATYRVRIPEGGVRLALVPEPWQDRDLEIVVAQLERCEPD